MHGRSSSSAGAIYLDRERGIDDLRRSAVAAKSLVPAIRRLILFGSLAAGTATPRSDSDILIVVKTSPCDHPRERIPEMLRALSPLPCSVDLFVLTSDEIERYSAEGSPLLRVAMSTGVDLL